MSITPARDRDTDQQVARLLGWTVRTMGAVYDPECGGLDVCVDCEFGPPKWAELGMEADPDWQHRSHDSEEPCYRFAQHGDYEVWKVVPRFSEDIAAAWTLVEEMTARDGVDVSIEYTVRRNVGEWWCRFNDTNHEIHNRYGSEDLRLGDGSAPTAPLAICRAFLAAMGGHHE